MTNDLRTWIDTVGLYEVTFTAAATVRWKQRTDKLWEASLDVGKRQLRIVFQRISGSGRQGAWRVDFVRRNSSSQRGTVGETTSVISGVAAAVREFLDTVQPELLKMSPTNTSRERLYRAILKRMMPALRDLYDLEEQWYGTLFGEFNLKRDPQWLYLGWNEPTDK